LPFWYLIRKILDKNNRQTRMAQGFFKNCGNNFSAKQAIKPIFYPFFVLWLYRRYSLQKP